AQSDIWVATKSRSLRLCPDCGHTIGPNSANSARFSVKSISATKSNNFDGGKVSSRSDLNTNSLKPSMSMKTMNFFVYVIRVSLSTNLRAMAQRVVGQNASQHRLADRHGPDPDTRIVTAFGHDRRVRAFHVNRLARIQDGRRRLHRKAHHNRLAAGN